MGEVADALQFLIEGKSYILDREKVLKTLRTHRVRAFVRALKGLEEELPLSGDAVSNRTQTMKKLSLEELGLVVLIYSEAMPQTKYIPYLIALDYNHEIFFDTGDDQFLWTYPELWAACGENPVQVESGFNSPIRYQELWRSVGVEPTLVERREDDGTERS